jgi:hypothetical protein
MASSSCSARPTVEYRSVSSSGASCARMCTCVNGLPLAAAADLAGDVAERRLFQDDEAVYEFFSP